jgi:hypothetical protein
MSAGPARDRLRLVAAARAEEALTELPKIARRLATLLAVLAVCIPVFVVVLAAIAWHFLF